MKTNIVVLSDLHVGSTIGLWPDHIVHFEDGGEYKPNLMQTWLYKCYRDALRQIKKLRPKPIVVINGDVVQAQYSRDAQLCTSKISAQQHKATELLRPLRAMAREFYMIRGTPFHDGKAGDNIEPIADNLEAKPNPATHQSTWWELWLDIGNCLIHFQHGIGVSSLPQYQTTIPMRDAINLLGERQRYHEDFPRLKCMVRSHRHRCCWAGVPPDLQAVVTPGWQFKGEFLFKKGSVMLSDFGWVLLQWDGQDLVVKPRTYTPPKPHIEEAG